MKCEGRTESAWSGREGGKGGGGEGVERLANDILIWQSPGQIRRSAWEEENHSLQMCWNTWVG